MNDNHDQQAPTGQVQRWADAAMYRAEPMPTEGLTVRLLNATPDPLGTIAAMTGIYKGRIVRDLSTVTDDQRRQVLADLLSTELQGPLEAATFVFLFEGVSRAWVDQLTRGRNAFYSVESLRFAVKDEDWAAEMPMPPSIAAMKEDDPRRSIWRKAMNQTEDAYAALVAAGVPAEDARSLLPMGIATRAYWSVSLRELLHVAGLRLCTQAQFEWRVVMAKVAEALRDHASQQWRSGERPGRRDYPNDRWQFQHVADLLRPVCYQKGTCGFMASFDRGCTIRERVEANGAAGLPSRAWSDLNNPNRIQPVEWLADPTAARRGDAR